MSSLPPVAATGSSGGGGGVPLFTPPQTPGHHVNGSISSVTSVVNVAPGVKRESSASESSAVVAGVKREGDQLDESAVAEEGSGREKRRRIAPTLVSGVDGSAPPEKPEAEGGGEGAG